MSDVVLYTIIILTAIGSVAAVILYFVAQKFKVYEDPRIDEVEEALPSANCGGCGFPGCRAFAETCAKAESLDGLFCPPGGTDTMKNVASILGLVAEEKEPQVAVLLCNGTPENRKKTSDYDGAENCTIAANLYGGESDCTYGCLGLGECVDACGFDAMYMDPETGLPVVIEDMCTACGACVDACPKNLFELRNKGKKSKRIFVSCMNTDKGAPAKKACDVACIGCSKCFKECKYDAIVMADNKAYIDYNKCVLCRACVAVCPTGAIHEINFPARRVKPAADVKTDAESAAKKEAAEAKVEAKAEPKVEATIETKEAPEKEAKTEVKAEVKVETSVENKEESNDKDPKSEA
jgi:Na+-translocating ferredoxin:NAD+ oxidoreductase RNF subunit RnfB